MVFSSPIFLFLFFPFTLLGYYLFRKNIKVANLFLLIVSLLFYAWGEPKFVIIMIGTVFLDYLLGLWGNRVRTKGTSTRPVIVVTAILNVGLLFIFKYLNFATENLHLLLGDLVSITQIVLPIGISFFSFQRQCEKEGSSSSWRIFHTNLSIQYSGQFLCNTQPQPKM